MSARVTDAKWISRWHVTTQSMITTHKYIPVKRYPSDDATDRHAPVCIINIAWNHRPYRMAIYGGQVTMIINPVVWKGSVFNHRGKIHHRPASIWIASTTPLFARLRKLSLWNAHDSWWGSGAINTTLEEERGWWIMYHPRLMEAQSNAEWCSGHEANRSKNEQQRHEEPPGHECQLIRIIPNRNSTRSYPIGDDFWQGYVKW